MTVRYVDGTNGNNAWDGLSAVYTTGTNGPKATLNGAEDTPVVAGDLVHVRPGTYRELLTCDVSGTAGNVIEYRGDYAGLIWPSTKGQVVRITGSDNDQTATRNQAITGTSKNYRTFTGFQIDTTAGGSGLQAILNSGGTHWTIDKCAFIGNTGRDNIGFTGAGQANNLVSNCVFYSSTSYSGVLFSHSSTVSDSASEVNNCIFIGGLGGVSSARVGGVTAKNSYFVAQNTAGVRVTNALAVGQTVSVYNSLFWHCNAGVSATTTAEFVENYNNFWNCGSNRVNVTAGANSLAYSHLVDMRWFFQLVTAGAGPNSTKQVISPFDLSSASQLIGVAGTSPTTTDMRGTAAISSVREWGALEYDSTLKTQGGGGAVSISPLKGAL